MESFLAVILDKLKVASPTAYIIFSAVIVGLNAVIVEGFLVLPEAIPTYVIQLFSMIVLALAQTRTKRHITSNGVSTLSVNDQDYDD